MNANGDLLWDLPTRLFHWSLLLLVVAQYASGKFGWFDLQWHFYAGYATLSMLLFRIAWGFVGSDSARFVRFVRGPRAVVAYLRGARNAGATHNPAGGWSVVLMLLLLLAMSLTGLATSDDIDAIGPLAARLDDLSIRFATHWHRRLADVLPWLILLHVVAVLWQERRGKRLIGPMLHGRGEITTNAPRIASNARAAFVFLLSAGVVYAVLRWAGG